MAHGKPTLGPGKICYLEIPAHEVTRASSFYQEAFGWEVRRRGDGKLAFDDGVGEVSGTWTAERAPDANPGIVVYVMVADLSEALGRVRAAGGEVVEEGHPSGERVAHVQDPAGNLIGVYEGRELAAREQAVAPVPEHLTTVTARLSLVDAPAALGFYVAAFDATEIGERFHLPDGTMVHAELQIGDAVVMVSEADGEPTRSLLATYWQDVDAMWERAIEAGAEIIHPLEDQFYGDRAGRLSDPFGQQWTMATRIAEPQTS
jgi:uncharacterized glyoxalase superfamily protein PhnB